MTRRLLGVLTARTRNLPGGLGGGTWRDSNDTRRLAGGFTTRRGSSPGRFPGWARFITVCDEADRVVTKGLATSTRAKVSGGLTADVRVEARPLPRVLGGELDRTCSNFDNKLVSLVSNYCKYYFSGNF